MTKTATELPPTLTTKTEAINWVQSMIRTAEEKRFVCNDMQQTVKQQQSAYRKFLIHYGSVLGTAGALFRVGWLTEGQYQEVQAGLLNLMLPTTVELPRG